MVTRDENGERPPVPAEEAITRAYSELATRLRVISRKKLERARADVRLRGAWTANDSAKASSNTIFALEELGS